MFNVRWMQLHLYAFHTICWLVAEPVQSLILMEMYKPYIIWSRIILIINRNYACHWYEIMICTIHTHTHTHPCKIPGKNCLNFLFVWCSRNSTENVIFRFDSFKLKFISSSKFPEIFTLCSKFIYSPFSFIEMMTIFLNDKFKKNILTSEHGFEFCK